ncbi:hypothetical protein [Nocardia heshunensis]
MTGNETLVLTTGSLEIDAMRSAHTALSHLDTRGRRRAMQWLIDALGLGTCLIGPFELEPNPVGTSEF